MQKWWNYFRKNRTSVFIHTSLSFLVWHSRSLLALFCLWNQTEAMVVQSLSHVWLPPHGLQLARLSCPSLSHGVFSDSWPWSQWCHLTISSSVAPFSSIRVFSNELALLHQVAKVLELQFQLQQQSFQWNSGLISFRSHWFNPCCSRASQESSTAPQFKF